MPKIYASPVTIDEYGDRAMLFKKKIRKFS
jgi:hypothetical protein